MSAPQAQRLISEVQLPKRANSAPPKTETLTPFGVVDYTAVEERLHSFKINKKKCWNFY